jgi:Kdo2-lipid IVA lauroyltransferase/acyltransferase
MALWVTAMAWRFKRGSIGVDERLNPRLLKRLRRRIRRGGEWVLVWVARAGVQALPRAWFLKMATALGTAAFRVSKRDRRVAFANLAVAFGAGMDAAAKKQVVEACFQRLARVVLDVLWFSRHTRERVARHVVVDPSLADAIRQAPAVFVTGHFGSWELLGQVIALQGCGLTTPAKPLASPAIGRLLNRFRATLGIQVVPVQGALRPLMREVKEGGIALLVVDQDTLPEEGGVFVDFFGVPVPMARSAAAIALKTGRPVVPVFCRPQADGTYLAYARQPVAPPPGDDGQAFTAAIALALETEIRRHPEDWVWVYKRWKRVVSWMDRQRYPYYADLDDVRL